MKTNCKKRFLGNRKVDPVHGVNFNSDDTLSIPIQKDDAFHFSIAPIAGFVQFLALMPVCGISRKNSNNLTFKWISLRVVYTVSYICYGIFLSVYFFKHIFKLGISARNIVGFIFFSYCTICAIVFFFVARKWPALMRVWSEKEKRFLCDPYKPHGSRLSKKIRITAIIVMLLAFFEHFFFVFNSAYNIFKLDPPSDSSVDNLSYFLTKQFPFLFETISFNLPLGVFVEVINLFLTFGWNYMELFLMMVSLGLVTRFGQINDRLNSLKGKVLPEKIWAQIRMDYVNLCELMERIDHELRFLILLSNLNNLYFICFQLLNIYGSLPFLINYVYFWFSLIYLFGRTLTAQYLAALVHDASNYPLTVLKDVPYEGWCIEVQRFIDQIRSQKMAFSGYKFFYLTRKSIMTMLATIVTYDIVLLQFDNSI